MVGGPSPKRGGCHEALLGVYLYQVPRPKCSAHVTEVVYQGTQKSDRDIHLYMTGHIHMARCGWLDEKKYFLFLNAVLWVTNLRICFGRLEISRDRYHKYLKLSRIQINILIHFLQTLHYWYQEIQKGLRTNTLSSN